MGRKSDAKERLQDAALELIWERSYGVVTIDAICEKAGVKKGSFYYFYESKADLAVAALEADWQANAKPWWDNVFSASVPPMERIRTFLQMTHDKQAVMQKEHGQILGCPCFSIGSEICTQSEVLRATAQEILQRQIRYFETAIRDAQARGEIGEGDPNAKAKCLYALFEGSLAQARIQNDLEFLRTLPSSAMEVLGVRKDATVA
ncbi:MAG: TetR family transcriptional regulator [Akkermansiaceae bacterium]|nr:TetR family transcriptional regulator [Akkermansiaceae bacterium]